MQFTPIESVVVRGVRAAHSGSESKKSYLKSTESAVAGKRDLPLLFDTVVCFHEDKERAVFIAARRKQHGKHVAFSLVTSHLKDLYTYRPLHA